MSLLTTRLQNAVFAFIVENAPVQDDANVFAFSFEDAPQIYYQVAATPLRDLEERLTLIFTTASRARHVFLTISDGDPHAVAGILAHIEDFHTRTKSFSRGDTVRFDDEPTMIASGRAAVLLLRPIVSPALSKVPDCLELAGEHVEFSLVVFLSEDEYRLKLASGLDALLDRFEEQEKDLAALKA